MIRTEDAKEKPNLNKEITVCYKDGKREKMTLKRALAGIDQSKNYQLCKVCKHDIDDHTPVKDYIYRLAGRCTKKRCRCRAYKPTELVSDKELKEEEA